MKTILKLEEVAQFVLGIFAFNLLTIDWWWFLVFFLAPDVGMVGYLVDNKIGAFVYNLFHHKGVAILIFITGIYLNEEMVQFTGIILFSHSAFDRMLGYGLKERAGFRYTHLGKIGKNIENIQVGPENQPTR